VVRPPFVVPKDGDRAEALDLVTRELSLAVDQAEALYRDESKSKM
jgi:hypothetical protein